MLSSGGYLCNVQAMTNLRLCERGLMSGDRTPLELLLLLLGKSACSASTSGVLLSLLS